MSTVPRITVLVSDNSPTILDQAEVHNVPRTGFTILMGTSNGTAVSTSGCEVLSVRNRRKSLNTLENVLTFLQ